MPRTRAKDHDDKRIAIMETAARIFANGGYDRTPMAHLAGECGVSKALIYHYYASKEALLFDIIETHLTDLIDAVEEADEPEAEPRARLESLVTGLLEAYRDADAKHKVQLGALGFLPPDQQEHLKGLERQLVVRFSDVMMGKTQGLSDGVIKVVGALVAALFLTFSDTYWNNAIEAEVYAMSAALMGFMTWLALRWVAGIFGPLILAGMRSEEHTSELQSH